MSNEQFEKMEINNLVQQNKALVASNAELQRLMQQYVNDGKFKMPKPTFPDLALPEAVDGKSPDMYRQNCEGQFDVMPDPATSPVISPADGRKRIMIGIPLLMVSYEFFESFLKFWTELQCSPRDYEICYHFAYRRPVHMAEEYLIKTAQFNKCTHILLMDDDIFDVTKADLDKLVQADRDVIGGVMHASKFPHAMCVFRRYDVSKKVIDMPVDNSMYRLYEVPCLCTKCGTGISHWDAKFCLACGAPQDNLIQAADLIPFPFTLIKLSVFDKIKKPWFHCTNQYPTDSWFCDRLLEVGLTPYAHMGVRLNHNGVTDESKPHYVQMGMIKAKKANGIVELTPQQMELHQALLMNRMKEAEEKQKAKPVITHDGKAVANAVQTQEYTLLTK